jgi:lipoprotein-releasing system permease protein
MLKVCRNMLTVTGIMRNEHNFAGIIFKGIGKDFDSLRFKKFLLPELLQKLQK